MIRKRVTEDIRGGKLRGKEEEFGHEGEEMKRGEGGRGVAGELPES